MINYKFLILTNETQDEHIFWEQACKANSRVSYSIVDLTKNTWLEDIQKNEFDYLLAKPGGLTAPFKELYDERIYILANELNYKIYPSKTEIFIYENKRFISFWLKAHCIPHPKTNVFYNIKEAKDFLNKTPGVIVAKTNIGASGSGVRILRTDKEKNDYCYNTFIGKGAPRRTGPNFEKGGILKRGVYYLNKPKELIKKLKTYKNISSSSQKGFVIFQEFIPHNFEWRVVRIGSSFFAHKKLKLGEKTSGSLLKGYDNPPLDLLDFVKNITDKHKLYSQAVDIFETDGKYLINEMQCIFGQSDEYQMIVDGEIGRYIYLENNWVFEKGNFAKNACYDLRLDYVINQLDNA